MGFTPTAEERERRAALREPTDARVLRALRQGPITSTAIAARLGIENTTVGNALRRLRATRQVEQINVFEYQLTDLGRAALRKGDRL